MTTTAYILAIVEVVVAFVVGVWLSARHARITDAREKERALEHMHRRPALDEAQFGQHYFPAEQADIAARIRQILARHIPIDLSRLHPDDRLCADIRMDELDSMATVEFVLAVEKEFGISISDSAAKDMRTLRDVIDYVSTHLPKAII